VEYNPNKRQFVVNLLKKIFFLQSKYNFLIDNVELFDEDFDMDEYLNIVYYRI